MPQKKTILVVRTSLDDIRKFKEEKIAELKNNKIDFSYSDFAIDSGSELYLLKVIQVGALTRSITDQLRGYANVDAQCILTELDKFVENIKSLCSNSSESISQSLPEAQNEPQKGEKAEGDLDTTNNAKNEEEQD